MKTACACAALVVAMLVTAGCGDDDDDDTQLGRAPDAGTGVCDPIAQNCPGGQQCVGGCNVTGVMAKVFTCAVPAVGATATHGQPCGVGCAPGNDCFSVSTDAGTFSVCRKYCRTDADCPNNRCSNEGLICTVGDPAPLERVCAL